MQRILAGEQLMTVYQPIKKIADAVGGARRAAGQGQEAAATSPTAKTDNGKEQVPSVLLATVVVTKDNINDTVIKDGFVKPVAALHGQVRAGLPDGRDLLAPPAGRARGRPPGARGAGRSRAQVVEAPEVVLDREHVDAGEPGLAARSRAACRRASPSRSPPTAAPPSRPAGSAGR